MAVESVKTNGKVVGPSVTRLSLSIRGYVQGGSNMTGTNLYVNKCKQSRSYLNHSVLYLLTYLPTYLLHGAESFLRS